MDHDLLAIAVKHDASLALRLLEALKPKEKDHVNPSDGPKQSRLAKTGRTV